MVLLTPGTQSWGCFEDVPIHALKTAMKMQLLHYKALKSGQIIPASEIGLQKHG